MDTIGQTPAGRHAGLYRLAIALFLVGAVATLVQMLVIWRSRQRITREGMRRVRAFYSLPLMFGVGYSLLFAPATIQVGFSGLASGYLFTGGLMPGRMLFWRPER
jgi:hypothetical protein